MGNKKKQQSPIPNRHVSELTSKPYKSRVKSQGLKANLRISLMPNAQCPMPNAQCPMPNPLNL
ncbi:hypothetical protein [Nostoc favosum]|uniref:Uncharacterized protein n=1 Tax=Nostoc favosum CHAB5714 TaxID=2780399 RepID=A0ABS8ICB0_9NOSO|nr:hypothetical protein [Nostoc favosum]MCC5601519.1 hypothetical protein [Nostoc favosum CHAB5714]